MASKPYQQLIDPQIPHTEFIGRFVFDVLIYTLRTFGCPRYFAIANIGENVYSRPNFARIAGVSVLRMCLVMRDKWRETLKGLRRKPVYDIAFFEKVLSLTITIAEKEGEEPMQVKVELTLAMCNEMALFFFSENIPFNFMDMIGTAVKNIVCLIKPPMYWMELANFPNAPRPNLKKELQKLFHEFENIWEFSRWLENFTQRHAVPYESKMNVTTVFYQEVRRRWNDIVEREYREGKPSNEKVKVNLGFLPKQVYDDIAAGASVPMPAYSEVTWGRKPTKSSESSERGAVGGKKSDRKRSTGSGSTSKQTAKGGQSSKDSSKPTAQGGQVSKDSSTPTAQDVQVSKDSSTPTARDVQVSKDSSEQAAQSGKDSLEMVIEDHFERINLRAEASSEKSQGAISKRRDHNK